MAFIGGKGEAAVRGDCCFFFLSTLSDFGVVLSVVLKTLEVMGSNRGIDIVMFFARKSPKENISVP